jgi:hypothetical protein
MPDPQAGTSTDVVTDPCSVNVGTDVSTDALSGCDLKGGQVLKFYYEEPEAPASSKENEVNPTLPSVVAAAPATDPHATVSADAAPAVPAAAEDNAADSHAVTEAPATAEHVEVPAAGPSAGELGDLISKNGGGAVGLIAALIAVVGGTAGFKLWTKISEQKHEQSMKKLDIEQANAGLSGAQPPPCQAAHHTLVADIKALQARVTALEARLEKVEKSVGGFDPSVDVGDLEERVEVLEKSFRKKARTVGGE